MHSSVTKVFASPDQVTRREFLYIRHFVGSPSARIHDEEQELRGSASRDHISGLSTGYVEASWRLS